RPSLATGMARAFGHGRRTRTGLASSGARMTSSLVPWQVTSTRSPAGVSATPYGAQPKPRSIGPRGLPRSAWSRRQRVSSFCPAVKTWVASSASVRGYWPTARSCVSLPDGAPKSRRATLLESGLTTKTWPSGATASRLERVGSAAAGAAASAAPSAAVAARRRLTTAALPPRGLRSMSRFPGARRIALNTDRDFIDEPPSGARPSAPDLPRRVLTRLASEPEADRYRDAALDRHAAPALRDEAPALAHGRHRR